MKTDDLIDLLAKDLRPGWPFARIVGVAGNFWIRIARPRTVVDEQHGVVTVGGKMEFDKKMPTMLHSRGFGGGGIGGGAIGGGGIGGGPGGGIGGDAGSWDYSS